jgi:hypothetical protein
MLGSAGFTTVSLMAPSTSAKPGYFSATLLFPWSMRPEPVCDATIPVILPYAPTDSRALSTPTHFAARLAF